MSVTLFFFTGRFSLATHIRVSSFFWPNFHLSPHQVCKTPLYTNSATQVKHWGITEVLLTIQLFLTCSKTKKSVNLRDIGVLHDGSRSKKKKYCEKSACEKQKSNKTKKEMKSSLMMDLDKRFGLAKKMVRIHTYTMHRLLQL